MTWGLLVGAIVSAIVAVAGPVQAATWPETEVGISLNLGVSDSSPGFV